MFKKLINRYVVITTIMTLVFSVMTPFVGVVNAYGVGEDDSGNWSCAFGIGHTELFDAQPTLESFFYRTTADSQSNDASWAYGYGYGYSDGEFKYGYGFGFGYNTFCGTVSSDGGEVPTARYGYFLFEEGSSLSLNLGVLVVDGAVTLPDDVTLSIAGGLGDVIFSNGTTISNADWDGTVEILRDDSNVPEGINAGNVVFVTLGGVDGPVALSGPAVIIIPTTVFDPASGIQNPVVKITDMAGTIYTVSECTDIQYNGGAIELPASYPGITGYENGAQHCYKYDYTRVAVATNHLSSFAAGSGTVSTDTSTTGGGGGFSYRKKSVKKVAVEGVVKAPAAKTVTDFEDLKNLKDTSWEYPVVEQMIELGLFKGSTNAKGERVLNMYGNMNRAEAAVLIARYLGYDDTTKITESPFSDIPSEGWYASSVSYLKSKGVIDGKTPTLFAPSDKVSRAEFFKMMVEAYLNLHPELKAEWDGLMSSGDQPFTDVKAKDWSYKYMRLAAAKNLLNGYEVKGKKVMKANNPISRVEGGSMMSKIFDLK